MKTRQTMFAAAAFLAAASMAWAQGIVIDEPPGPTPEPAPREFRAVHLKQHVVEATIRQGVAETKIDQVFHNPNAMVLEGTYVFPLPETAAIGKFSMFMDGKEIAGEILEADQARSIYESIVRRQQDPGLLEYVGRKMIRARVFPIPAQGDVRIRISYAQELETEGSVTAYEYPLSSIKFSREPLESVRVTLDLQSDIPVKSIYSPTHAVEIVRKGDHEATIAFEGEKVVADADFRLYYQVSKKDLGLALLTHRPAGEEGYFLVMVSPKEEYAADEIAPKDLTVVVDTSGSMLGTRMDQAKAALVYFLEHLDPRDRFRIIRFSTDVDASFETLADANEENLRKAKAWVGSLEARGGTNIEGGLAKALETRPVDGRLPMIVFITDGKPTIGERDTNKILEGVRAKNPAGARIFVFGVGDDLNTHLLDLIAEQNDGTRSYVGEKDDLQAKVASFYEKVSSPVLADLELTFDGIKVKDLYPKRLPDLFKGMQLVLFGRYEGEGDHVVKLTGKVGGQSREYVYEGSFPASQESSEFLPRLWARRKVAYLMDEIRLHGESQELKDEVVRLGKQYGIVTPYTAFLVLEPGMNPGDLTGQEDGGRPGLGGGGRMAFRGGAVPPAATAKAPEAPADPATREANEAEARDRENRLGEYFKSMGGSDSSRAESGRDAVEHSQKMEMEKGADKLYDDDARKAGIDSLIQAVEDKTFVWLEGAWIDTAFDAEAKLAEEKVEFLSDAYFELLKKLPKMSKYLSIGDSIVVVLEGKVYRIERAKKVNEEGEGK